MPQSRRMRTVERITRSGDVLTIETTHRDPAYYRRPLVVSIPYTSSDLRVLRRRHLRSRTLSGRGKSFQLGVNRGRST